MARRKRERDFGHLGPGYALCVERCERNFLIAYDGSGRAAYTVVRLASGLGARDGDAAEKPRGERVTMISAAGERGGARLMSVAATRTELERRGI